MIQLQEITLAYGPKTIFNDLSAIIHGHDRIGLVGANGSGKSTFIKMLLGEVEPDKGKIDRPGFFTLGYLPQDGIAVKGKTLCKDRSSARSTHRPRCRSR